MLGASASGKSLLMQALSGRVQNLSITGEILMNGVEANPADARNEVGYVPQDDSLIGELSAKEMLRNTALMKRNKSREKIEKDVSNLLNSFGLNEVADNTIGTAFVRGLSGGQRRRVDIGTELIAAPKILFLDEPTSGLDGSIAYDVLSSIKSIVKSSEGRLSIMLSIHQPNSRILELFDNIMILAGGGMIFFGTVEEASAYFSYIGFPPPVNYTPTDFYLKISDPHFGTRVDYDFEGSFYSSRYCAKLISLLDTAKRSCGLSSIELAHKYVAKNMAAIAPNETPEFTTMTTAPSGSERILSFTDSSRSGVQKSTFWRQYFTLVLRDVTLAARDPSLYYLQFVLVAGFGFLIGAAFLKLKYESDDKMSNITSSLLWIVMCMTYIQVFKVYHLSKANHRFHHERANNTYDVLPYFLAELTVTATLLLSFIPGAAIAYFMIGFPNQAFPFLLFTFWLVRNKLIH